MDSEKGNRVFARGHNVPPPWFLEPPKKPGLDRVNAFFWHHNYKKKKTPPQADQRMPSSAKHCYVYLG